MRNLNPIEEPAGDGIMAVLSAREIDAVSGAGPLSAFIGSAVIAGSTLANDVLDAVAPIGWAINQIGGPLVAKTHELGDALIYAVSRCAVGIGHSLGGDGTVNYHYLNEWGNVG